MIILNGSSYFCHVLIYQCFKSFEYNNIQHHLYFSLEIATVFDCAQFCSQRKFCRSAVYNSYARSCAISYSHRVNCRYTKCSFDLSKLIKFSNLLGIFNKLNSKDKLALLWWTVLQEGQTIKAIFDHRLNFRAAEPKFLAHIKFQLFTFHLFAPVKGQRRI